MAVRFEPWENGAEYGTKYTFDLPGDCIPMHAHLTPSERHSTRCLKGSCAVYGDSVNSILLPEHDLKFKSFRMHEIVALEPGTEIVNILDGGKPASYAEIEDANLRGQVQGDRFGYTTFE